VDTNALRACCTNGGISANNSSNQTGATLGFANGALGTSFRGPERLRTGNGLVTVSR